MVRHFACEGYSMGAVCQPSPNRYNPTYFD
jgi:hypothetical protein